MTCAAANTVRLVSGAPPGAYTDGVFLGSYAVKVPSASGSSIIRSAPERRGVAAPGGGAQRRAGFSAADSPTEPRLIEATTAHTPPARSPPKARLKPPK